MSTVDLARPQRGAGLSGAAANAAAVLRAHAAVIAPVAAAAWWLVIVTRMWAGRDAPSVTVGAILLAVAVAVVRPDRVLPASVLVLAAAISAGAFLVPLTAPTGWAGAPDAAIYACGAWLAVVVAAAVVARPQASSWLLVVVVASAGTEFMSGWTAWWGGQNPALPMLGTFYWHNPYAAFLVPGGLAGVAMWLWRRRIVAALGLVCFTLAAVGIVYSTSRAGLGTFVVGFVLVTAVVAVAPDRWRRLARLATAAAAAAAVTLLIAGPPFFPHRASPLAAVQTRAVTQPLGQNTDQRIGFWREAITVFFRHPVTGGGYKSLVAEASGHLPKSVPLSPYAHSGYLQALGEGGLLLGVPFLLAVLLLAVLCVRRLVAGLVRRQGTGESTVVAVALACLFLHSAVDFDWAYAADFAVTAVVAGLVVGQWLTDRQADGRAHSVHPRRAVAAVLSLAVGVGLLGVSAWVMRHGNHQENLVPAPHHHGGSSVSASRR